MLCERIQELMSDYLDGTLSAAFVATVDQHTGECESCRLELIDLRAVWKLLDEAPVLEAPPSVRSLAWARIEQQAAEAASAPVKTQQKWSWKELFARRSVVGMAAMLLIVVMGGVAIPAQFKQARMVFPYNLFYTVEKNPLTIQKPRVEIKGTQRWIMVPVVNHTSKPVTVTTRVVRPEGPDVAPAKNFTVEAGKSDALPVGVLDLSTSQSMTVHVIVEGSDGDKMVSMKDNLTIN
jgi:hypothetical protein